MKNILTEALVNSATNASFIFSYTNSAKLKILLKLQSDFVDNNTYEFDRNIVIFYT